MFSWYQLTLVSSCSSFIVLVSCVFRLSCVCLHCDSDSSFSSSSSLRRFFSSIICFRELLTSVRFRRDSFNCNFMSCNVADVFFNSFSMRFFSTKIVSACFCEWIISCLRVCFSVSNLKVFNNLFSNIQIFLSQNCPCQMMENQTYYLPLPRF